MAIGDLPFSLYTGSASLAAAKYQAQQSSLLGTGDYRILGPEAAKATRKRPPTNYPRYRLVDLPEEERRKHKIRLTGTESDFPYDMAMGMPGFASKTAAGQALPFEKQYEGYILGKDGVFAYDPLWKEHYEQVLPDLTAEELGVTEPETTQETIPVATEDSSTTQAAEDALAVDFPLEEESRIYDPGLESVLQKHRDQKAADADKGQSLFDSGMSDLDKGVLRGDLLMGGMALAQLPVALQKRRTVPSLPSPEYSAPNIRSGAAGFKAAQGAAIDKQVRSAMDYATRAGRPEAYNPADALAAEAEKNIVATQMEVEAINKTAIGAADARNRTEEAKVAQIEKGVAMQAQYDALVGKERAEATKSLFNIGLSNISMHNKAAEIKSNMALSMMGY